MTTQTKSLYDRLGGLDAINAVTESWVARVGGDDRANGKFVRTDIPRLKKEAADQLCEATGGPCTYTGRSMRETRRDEDHGRRVRGRHAASRGHARRAPYPQAGAGRAGRPAEADAQDIVEVESPQTGTPLPDSYQAALPLT
jgi:Bacterial-like globin